MVGRAAGRSPAEASAAVLIYDDECPICRASALWLMRLALSGGALEILPCRAEPRRTRFPQVSDAACSTAMQLVLPDGRVLAGGDAVPELLRRVRGLGWVAAVFALPGMRPLARRVYGWLAANRIRISCRLAAGRALSQRSSGRRP